MRKAILCLILALLAIGNANAERYFVLDVNHVSGSLTFNSISLKESDRAITNSANAGFLVRTVSFENAEIGKMYYSMPENKNYIIYVPYSQGAAKVEIYDQQNSKRMEIDVSSFADTCGNGKCESHESYESCTNDCASGSKDDFCDGLKDNICDPDCPPKSDADCTEENSSAGTLPNKAPPNEKKGQNNNSLKQSEKPDYLLWALPVFGIILVILAFFLVKKRKESKIVASLKQYAYENIRRGYTVQQIELSLSREGYAKKEIEKAIKSI